MNEYIVSDVIRYKGRFSYRNFASLFLKLKSFRYMTAHRLFNGSTFEKIIGKILYFFVRNGPIKIPMATKIGYGFYIGHDGPVVVNPTAIIGNNVNISQFTTIGSNEGHAARIGDNVYIGPSVCIVEDVVIGNNVTIGAGSVVTKDIPANATAVGNYAKVINYDINGRFVNNRYEIQN